MKLLRQLTLIILFSLLLNSLTLILLARYQQRQLLAASQETLNHTLNHSNTVSLTLAGFASTFLLFCIGYYFARKLTRPIEQLTTELDEYNHNQNQTIINNSSDGEFEELIQLRKALKGITKIQKSTLQHADQREQELAATLNNIGDAVIITNAEGLVTQMNPIAEQLTSWSFTAAKDMPLKSVISLIDASTREPIGDPSWQALYRGETADLSNHTLLLAKDGNEYHIANFTAPLRRSDNAILGMVLVFNSINEESRLREKDRERDKAVYQQMQGLLNGLRTTTGILNCDGTLVFTNDTPLKATEIQMADVIGKKFWDCPWWNYDSKIRALVKSDVIQARAGKSTSRDVLGFSPRGLFWIQLNVYPVRDDNGRIIQLVAEGVAIHKRKLTEEMLRESNQHLQVYRDQSPLAIIEWDATQADGVVCSWNKAAEKMFGYTFEEVKGKRPQFLAPAKLDLKLDQLISDLKARTSSETLISKNLTKDGRIIYCQWYNAPLKDAAGELIGCDSILRDITAEREAQRALAVSEAEQRDILSSMREALITIEETGTVLSVNKTAEKLFGYCADEIVGHSVLQLIPEPLSREFTQNMSEYLRTGNLSKLGAGSEIQALRKNGELFPTRLSVAEFSVTKDGKRRFIVTCQNLSQVKQQEEQLRRSQKMDALGKLTGGIAHDFNNMLGVVSGYSELLQAALASKPELAKYVDEIAHAGQRGAKLTQRLLSFARNERSPTVTELVNINTLLQSQQHMLEKTLTPRIALILHLEENLWPVKVNSGELEDAILNMCINAMHAMEHSDNCQLSLQTRNEEVGPIDSQALQLPPGDYVLVSITDTGCGMDKETREQVFDPFFSTKGAEGTGLGLSQVYGFIKQSKGAIKVYSEPNQGTQFVFYFPCAQSSEQAKTAAKTADIQVSGK